MKSSGVLLLGTLSLFGCPRETPAERSSVQATPSIPSPTRAAQDASGSGANPNGAVPSYGVGNPVPTIQHAQIGANAPDFALPDLDKNTVRLGDQRGKIVVLEWFNPECPFVKANHTRGPLKDMAKRQTSEGIVWLAVNSSAPGKQGHGVDVNKQAAATFGMAHPILLDESGDVGHAYDAQHTPTIYVVDRAGKLVYRGAIDNAADGEPISGEALVNHVQRALDELKAGRPVSVAETKAYGCHVKYLE